MPGKKRSFDEIEPQGLGIKRKFGDSEAEGSEEPSSKHKDHKYPEQITVQSSTQEPSHPIEPTPDPSPDTPPSPLPDPAPDVYPDPRPDISPMSPQNQKGTKFNPAP